MNISRTEFYNIYKPLLFLILIFTFCFSACYQAPVTGRNQFILLSQAQETQMGATAYNQVLQEEKISNDPQYNAAVKRVGNRIAKVANGPGYSWEFTVIKADDTINAFALPGGKVAVYTGILKVAETDVGLATVMSHEIAHAIARHGAERMSAGILEQLGAVGISAALGGSNPGLRDSILQAYGLGVTVGGVLPFSRKQESEADHIGLIYMARAGYDPREAVKFWQRMEDAAKGRATPPEFLSTHPGHETRIHDLQTWMPEALKVYQNSQKAPNNRIAR